MQDAPRNHWYLAAWSHEVGDRPLRRHYFGVPTVLFRDQEERIAVLLDICPHRFAALSDGRVVAGGIECPYHGLRFGRDGRCVDSPLTQAPPHTAVRSFPVVERDGFIWFWPGDLDRAEGVSAPDYSHLKQHEGYRFLMMYMRQHSSFLLGVDNLMDLSHAAFLHRSSLAQGTDAIVDRYRRARYSARTEDGKVVSRWEFLEEDGSFQPHRWIESVWEAPARIVISQGFDRRIPPRIRRLDGLHLLTPATEGEAHYFTIEAYDPAFEPDDFEDRMRIMLTHNVFGAEDDVAMMRVAEHMAGRGLMEMEPVILPSDKGAILARRHLTRLVKQETGI